MGSQPTNCALLIIDMIGDFSFEGGEQLAAHAGRVVANMARLKARFQAEGLPVVFVNDNYGRWDASLVDLVAWARREGSRGRDVATQLQPTDGDLFVLKPRHSGFYQTPLPSLLESKHVGKLVIVGVAGDSCVLNTAMDAHMRKFRLWVPRDAVASITPERNERALAHLHESVQVHIGPVREIDQRDVCDWPDAGPENGPESA
jgi:nicotinamidase-related amidase